MKRLLTLPLFLCLFGFASNAQKVVFSYDAAGNQQTRTWICVNCVPASGSKPEVTEIVLESTKKSDSSKIVQRKIFASPNPLVEKLNVDWQTEEGISVRNLKVFNVQGNRVHELKPASADKGVTIPFQQLPTGTYIVYVTFSDQRTESIKVIKK